MWGCTALMSASSRGHADVVSVLLSAGEESNGGSSEIINRSTRLLQTSFFSVILGSSLIQYSLFA